MKAVTFIAFSLMAWPGYLEPAAKAADDAPANVETSEIGKASLSNAKQLGVACKLYALDHDGDYPPNLLELYPDYLATKELFPCPMVPGQDLGYAYVGGKVSDPPKQPLLYSKSAFADGKWVVVYNDLTGEFVKEKPKRPKELEKAESYLK